MQLEIKNNAVEMYEQYLNGIPVSKLSKITGIKPKAIYKRFERMQKTRNTVDNVDKTVDNVKVLTSIGVTLASFGKYHDS